MQQHDQERVSAPARSPDVGCAGLAGEAGLEPDGALIAGEQLVVIGQRNLLAVAAGERTVRRADDRGEHRVAQHCPADQREVVRRRVLLGCVQARGVDGQRVVRAEPSGLRRHESDGTRVAAGRLRERLRGVVRADDQHRAQQVGDAVTRSLIQVGFAAGDADGLRRRRREPIGRQHRPQCQRGQQFQGAGRRQWRVGIAGREHGTGVRVRDEPRLGAHHRGQDRRAGCTGGTVRGHDGRGAAGSSAATGGKGRGPHEEGGKQAGENDQAPHRSDGRPGEGVGGRCRAGRQRDHTVWLGRRGELREQTLT